MTPFDFHESKPVEYYLHMIGHIPYFSYCTLQMNCLLFIMIFLICNKFATNHLSCVWIFDLYRSVIIAGRTLICYLHITFDSFVLH